MRLLLAFLLCLAPVAAQGQDARRAEERAIEADDEARRLTARARSAEAEAERLAERRVAVAAEVQRLEARAAKLQIRIARLEDRHAAERASLAERQLDAAKLLAALQSMARRPASAALLAPDTAVATARVSAMILAIRPQIAARTHDLRAALERTRAARRALDRRRKEFRAVAADLQTRAGALQGLEDERRRTFAALERDAGAARERARRLAARAVDLQGLANAAGPTDPDRRLRSFRPGRAEIERVNYRAPVIGKVRIPFGRANKVGVLQRGVTVVPRGPALVTAPAGGFIAYAGPFRRYGRIVILEHENAMVTLLSGLSETSVEVGETVRRGAPLGRTAQDGELYVELRRRGRPVDPMLYLSRSSKER